MRSMLSHPNKEGKGDHFTDPRACQAVKSRLRGLRSSVSADSFFSRRPPGTGNALAAGLSACTKHYQRCWTDQGRSLTGRGYWWRWLVHIARRLHLASLSSPHFIPPKITWICVMCIFQRYRYSYFPVLTGLSRKDKSEARTRWQLNDSSARFSALSRRSRIHCPLKVFQSFLFFLGRDVELALRTQEYKMRHGGWWSGWKNMHAD